MCAIELPPSMLLGCEASLSHLETILWFLRVMFACSSWHKRLARPLKSVKSQLKAISLDIKDKLLRRFYIIQRASGNWSAASTWLLSLKAVLFPKMKHQSQSYSCFFQAGYLKTLNKGIPQTKAGCPCADSIVHNLIEFCWWEHQLLSNFHKDDKQFKDTESSLNVVSFGRLFDDCSTETTSNNIFPTNGTMMLLMMKAEMI